MSSHGPACNCFRCNPESRGSAALPRLSEEEPSVMYSVRLPESLRDACRAAGAARVREILEQGLR